MLPPFLLLQNVGLERLRNLPRVGVLAGDYELGLEPHLSLRSLHLTSVLYLPAETFSWLSPTLGQNKEMQVGVKDEDKYFREKSTGN